MQVQYDSVSPLKELPFDVRNWNTIQYSKGQTFALRELLAKKLSALLENDPNIRA